MERESQETIESILMNVPEDMFLAEFERRRAERKTEVRRPVQRAYYERNRDKILAQQRDYRKAKSREEEEVVAPTPR